jgi:hypothetical protein
MSEATSSSQWHSKLSLITADLGKISFRTSTNNDFSINIKQVKGNTTIQFNHKPETPANEANEAKEKDNIPQWKIKEIERLRSIGNDILADHLEESPNNDEKWYNLDKEKKKEILDFELDEFMKGNLTAEQCGLRIIGLSNEETKIEERKKRFAIGVVEFE